MIKENETGGLGDPNRRFLLQKYVLFFVVGM